MTFSDSGRRPVVLFVTAPVLLVRIEIIEEQVVIFNTVLQVIHHFLFFIDIDAEASAFVEYVIFIITVINFARKAATACKD